MNNRKTCERIFRSFDSTHEPCKSTSKHAQLNQQSERANTHLVSIHESDVPVSRMLFSFSVIALWPLKAGLTTPFKFCRKRIPLGSVCLAWEGRATERNKASSTTSLIWIYLGTSLFRWP
jgi:hypothetical protein